MASSWIGALLSALVLGGLVGTGGAAEGADSTDADSRHAVTSSFKWGGTQDDWSTDVAVGPGGDLFVVGVTESLDLPTKNAAQNRLGGSDGTCQTNATCVDGFVARFTSEGSLVYATYLGGREHDALSSVAVGESGEAWVTGHSYSDDFPTTPDAVKQGSSMDAGSGVLVKLSPDGSILYSTYIGGDQGDDDASAVELLSSGDPVVTGWTRSLDFPVSEPPSQPPSPSSSDAFIMRLSDSGQIVWSKRFGGSQNDDAFDLAVTSGDVVHTTGATHSSDFPLVNPAVSDPVDFDDAFVASFDGRVGMTVFSSYVGGKTGDDVATSIDVAGTDVVLTGLFFRSQGGAENAHLQQGFMDRIDPVAARREFRTILDGAKADIGNGIASIGDGVTVATGTTESTDFPMASPIYRDQDGEQMYVSILDAQGGIRFSTLFGGHGKEPYCCNVADSGNGSFVLAGATASTDFPLVGHNPAAKTRGWDVTVTLFRPTTSPCTLIGTARNDSISGTDWGETICSGRGADRVRGRGGPDLLKAGGGPDHVRAGSGHDVVRGGRGSDTVRAGRGRDICVIDLRDWRPRGCEIHKR